MYRGRGEVHALKTEQADTLQKQKSVILSTLKGLPNYKPADGTGLFGGLRRQGERYIVANLMIDRIAAEIDGNPMQQGKEMGLMQRLVDGVRKGEVNQMQMIAKFRAESEVDFAVLDGFNKRMRKQFGGDSFPVDGVDVPALIQEKRGDRTWNPEMLKSIFFNMGNVGNLHALEQGYGLTFDKLQKLAKLATAEEWRAIERVAQRMEQYFPQHAEVFFRQTHTELPKVAPTLFTVETSDGQSVTLSGWYYPLNFDRQLIAAEGGQVVDVSEYSASMDAINNTARSAFGFTHTRQADEFGNPVVGLPPLLKMSVLPGHVVNATRWISHADALFEFRRLLVDEDVKAAMLQKVGEEKYRALRQWANRMARPNRGAQSGVNQMLSTIRKMRSAKKIGLNLKTAARQAEFLGVAADAMTNASASKSSGWYWLMQGFKQMGLDGFLSGWIGYENDAVKQMRELSPEADARLKAVSKEIREFVAKEDPTKTSGVQIGKHRLHADIFFHFSAAMNQSISGTVWWAAYNQGMNGAAGFDTAALTDAQIQEKAIQHADAILRTQQSPFRTDFTQFHAGGETMNLLTQFSGAAAARLSNTYGLVQLWRQGGKSTTDLARHLVNSYSIPVLAKLIVADVLYGALAGGGGDDEDEDKSLAGQLAWGTFAELTRPLPVIRDVTRTGKKVARGAEKLVDGEVESAVADFGKAFVDVVPKAMKR